MIDTRWHLLEDPEAVAAQAAQRMLQAANRAIAAHGRFRIVLAGGNTPQAAYRGLVDADTDWSCWSIYFGDERCLPATDPQRNSRMAAQALLDKVPLAAENLFAIPAERGAEAAAGAYRPVVEAALPFDFVLLGMGEDGHTASLFPGQIHPVGELVHAVHNAPKPPSDRVSLSAAALSSADELVILATGVGKRAAVHAWRCGVSLPIARIGGPKGVDVLLDRAAAG